MKRLAMLMAVLVSAPAFAKKDDCDHPVFVEKACVGDYIVPGAQGPAGADGQDGVDGKDGVDGLDGVDGVAGRDGIDGVDGRNGVDGRDGRDGVSAHNYRSEFRDYLNASNAIQIHLPRSERNRLTAGVSGGNSDAAVGLGYARRLDDTYDFTVGLGRAGGGTVVWQFGVSGEF